ncbi:MAG TPA: hypothetical protein VF933_08020 [Streptosporangiaceae bacterium]
MESTTGAAITLVSTTALGPFSWRWPEGLESFDRGWAAVASLDGERFHVRHGIGRREVFGRSRVHSVTWVEGAPIVEGVEADDFARSDALLSLLKVTKRHVRPGGVLPPGYASLQTVVMSDEIAAPYSPRSLAVKLRTDDVEGWTRHALLRAHAWGRLRPRRQLRVCLPPSASAGPAPIVVPIERDADVRPAVVAALLAYVHDHEGSPDGTAVDFTASPQANDLLRSNPFAFLLGVLFDQNIPAERAWIAPYLLQQRLGHLDPARIANDLVGVHAAIGQVPTLHRYVEKMPRWVVSAAQHVMTTYHGDAGTIWSSTPAADELQRRFRAFTGIAQKKAAMAVEILERDLGVPVAHLHRSDVAYDVHLRRVFLRTRLADRDDRDHMIAVARALHPERPGVLDFPAWRIGRNWCHPGLPDCAPCPLTHVCPKDIERAAQVTSA